MVPSLGFAEPYYLWYGRLWLDGDRTIYCDKWGIFLGSQSLLNSAQAMPKDSHAFLGWTNRRFPTSLSSFLEQEAERKLSLSLWITNPFSNIVGRLYPRNGSKKWKDRNMGIDLIPIRTIYFNCCVFWNCIPIQGFKFRSIFAELIIPLENEDLK